MEGRAQGLWAAQELYNRFIRWSRLGVFDRIFAALAGERPKAERIMIDSTHLKAPRTAASLLKNGIIRLTPSPERDIA
jgi:transposase